MENTNNIIDNAEDLFNNGVANQVCVIEKKNEVTSQTENTNITEIEVKISDIKDLIPKEEQAEEIETPSEYANAKEIGYFSPAAGMAQLENVMDGCVYAAVMVDEKGNRYIQYCQKYSNGSFSARMSIAQSDLLFAATNNFMLTDIKIPVLKTKLNKFMTSVTEDYLGKFNGDKPLNIQELLTALCGARNKLPVYMDKVETTPEQFYLQVVEALNKLYPEEDNWYWVHHKAYYALIDLQIEQTANEMQMDSKTLLEKLKEYKFLYLTPSSRKYQTKIRCEKDKTDWAYCILRLEYLGKQEIENKTV